MLRIYLGMILEGHQEPRIPLVLEDWAKGFRARRKKHPRHVSQGVNRGLVSGNLSSYGPDMNVTKMSATEKSLGSTCCCNRR